MPDKKWSNLARIVTRRTYSRSDNGFLETWDDTTERAILGNVKGRNVPDQEVAKLLELSRARKSGFAGRGWWFSGTKAHAKLGGAALNNCWVLTAHTWENFIVAQDLLMLGGGVGMSVEHKYSSKLPKVKKDVTVVHQATKDASFIVPDSREGWNELTRRVLEAYFVTGKSFSYSTICVRGKDEPILGFGGTASGPIPLTTFISTLSGILQARAGKFIRPIDAADILTSIGQLVVSGNVRRSAILIQGDCYDKDFLRAKRWDLGDIPNHRACANYSVAGSDIDDFHPLFWKTFENGEAFGIINLESARKFGRMGELKPDTCVAYNPCGEAGLENGESCNLAEQALPNMANEDEFVESSRLWFRAAKRVTLEPYHHAVSQEVISRNRRVGVGITGCLASPLFNPKSLDRAYQAIQKEDEVYSKELGVPRSLRTTVIKPSGTMSKVFDCNGYEGIHPAYSRYIIQRIRFGSGDALIPKLRAAGHRVEPVIGFNGVDPNTLVVDFYVQAPDGFPVADEDWDTWKQLDAVLMAQKYWADQSVSCTVYYKKEDIPKLKAWLADNLKSLKTISFLCHDDHGFKQAPKEKITKEQFEKLSAGIKELSESDINDGALESLECEGGLCPVK